MSEKIELRTLVIEVTRRCNARCDHCMRGDAQDVNINPEYIRTFLKQVGTIDCMTFTGGEPSLNVPAIKETLNICKEFGIEVRNFYMATNALNVSDDFLLTIMEWYVFCSENDITAIDISNDIFHPGRSVWDEKKLKVFNFSRFKYDSSDKFWRPEMNLRGEGLISQGRGVNYPEARFLDAEQFSLIIDSEGERKVDEGTIYLNALGGVIGGCDWSYDNQDGQEICKAGDNLWDTLIDLYGEEIVQDEREPEAAMPKGYHQY